MQQFATSRIEILFRKPKNLDNVWNSHLLFKVILVSLLFLFVSFAFKDLTAAQLSLQDLLQRAEKHAALTKDFDALRRSAAAKLGQVKMMRILPEFTLKAYTGVVPDATMNENDLSTYRSADFENGFDVSKLGPFWKLEIEAVQPIFTFGKISNYLEAAGRAPALAELERKVKLAEVHQIVKKAYYTLLFSRESLAILKEVEEKLGQANEKVEELLVKNAENVSEVDRLKISVFRADVRNRSLDAERARRLSFSTLSEIAGLGEDWQTSQEGLEAESFQMIKKEDVISAALRSEPKLNQLGEVIEMKDAERRAVRAEMLPSFFIAGRLNYAHAPGRTNVENPFLNDPFNTYELGAVLGLKQDLGIHKTLKKVEALEAEVDRMKAQKEQLALKVRLDAERVFEEAMAASEAIKINEDGFRAARSWLTSTGLSFNLGTAETKEVLESFAAYFKARFDLIKSIYTLNLSLADLTQISGLALVQYSGETPSISQPAPSPAAEVVSPKENEAPQNGAKKAK